MPRALELAMIAVGVCPFIFSATIGCCRKDFDDSARFATPITADVPSNRATIAEDLANWLPVAYQGQENQGWAIGYINEEQQVFLRWKGVVIPRQYVNLRGGPGNILERERQIKVSLVDPPLDYVLTAEGHAEPGYYDQSLHHFYRWRGVRFDAMKAPAAIVGMPRNPEGRFPFRILDIDVPDHRRELAHYLNSTVR